MVPAEIPGIDHLVVLVDDLDKAAHEATTLGFTATPLSTHSRLGSANHCLMFAGGDYLELMGFAEDSPHLADLRKRLVKHGPGPAAIALVTEDAERGYRRLAEAGLEPEPPLDFGRQVTLPTGELTEVAFRIVRIPATGSAGKTPGPPLFLCEHQTRDQVWHPGWLEHANGVRALSTLRGTAPTPEALADMATFYRRVFGEGAVQEAENRLEIRPERGALMVWRLDPTVGEVELREVELVTDRQEGEARAWGCELRLRVGDPNDGRE